VKTEKREAKKAEKAEKKLTKKRRKSVVSLSRSGSQKAVIRSGSLADVDVDAIEADRTKIKAIVVYRNRDEFECTLSYIIRDLDQFDQVIIFKNTNNEDDLEYLGNLDARLPDKFLIANNDSIKKKKIGTDEAVYELYAIAREENTFYLKLDHDVVYAHEDAYKNLIEFALAHKDEYAVFSGNVVNNGPLDAIHQEKGASLTNKLISRDDPYKVLHKLSGAQQVHASFCIGHEGSTLDKYYLEI